MKNFIASHKLTIVEPSAAAAQTALTSDILDMANFDGATFIAHLGDVTATSVLTLTIEHGDEAGGGDMAATTCAATFTAGASDADNKLLAAEIHYPTKRYCRAVLTRTTADAVVNGILAIQHHPKVAPVTQSASVIATDFDASPASA